jgi:hypothetical protein
MKIHSSNIEEAFYSWKSHLLMVVFKSGGAYVYKDVSPSTWQDFRDAPSRGSYFATYIRNEYDFTKLASSTPKEKKEREAA